MMTLTRTTHIQPFATLARLGSLRFLTKRFNVTKARALSSKSKPISDSIFPHSNTSLGLEARFVTPHLASITQLPEVSTALENTASCYAAIDPLKRAVDIFGTLQSGGNEHRAILALLAECQQRSGNYDAAGHTLIELEQFVANSHNFLNFDVALARAKTLWLNGQFDQAKLICDELLEQPAMEALPLHYASARTGQALARLLSLETLDDAFSVRDPSRMAVKTLEQYRPAFLPLAAAELNVGTTEAVYAQFVGNAHDIEVPLDNAMRAWKRGLTILKRQSKDKVSVPYLEAYLNGNMAWGLLQMPRLPNNVEQASEYAANALKIHDKMLGEINREGFARTLNLVATCYHRTNQAVTSEGLFQTAVDQKKNVSFTVSTQQKIELRDVFRSYAALCRQWEKRENDAERLERQSNDIENSLPNGWKGKSSIHSSLWFWTPSLSNG
jgi:tetratricopeptide (TPR) repeat protein